VFELKLVGPFKVGAFGFLIRRTRIVLYISYLDKKSFVWVPAILFWPPKYFEGHVSQEKSKNHQKT